MRRLLPSQPHLQLKLHCPLLTAQVPSSTVVDVPSNAQEASFPDVDTLSTSQLPSSPVVDVPSNAQSDSSPVLYALSTSQLPSSPVVDVPSTAQSPSNPALKADVSSKYQPPLLLSNSYRKTLPKSRCHGPVMANGSNTEHRLGTASHRLPPVRNRISPLIAA